MAYPPAMLIAALFAGAPGGIKPQAAPAVIATLDERALRRLEPGESIIIERVVLPDAGAVSLELRRFTVSGPETRFAVGRDGVLDFDPRQVVLLRGRASGDGGSHVFMSFSPRGLRGTIALGGGGPAFLLDSGRGGGAPGAGPVVRITPARPVGGTVAGVFCGVGDEAFSSPPPRGPVPARGLRQIELAVETDYEYFTLFGDLDAAAAYVLELYGAVSDLYQREVGAYVSLSFVRLWDDPDDLFNGERPLDEFRDWWNQNMQGVPRDAAQFLSGRRDLPYGGVARVAALCDDQSYSVAAYTIGSFFDPARPDVFNRDIIVTAHELGHNCAAPHTHSLGLDTCNDENSPPRRGTIMSYCGQTFTGGSANQDLRFHTEIQGIIEPFLDERGCIAADCNANGVPDELDIGGGASEDVNENGVPDECEDCNGNGVLDEDDLAGGTSQDVNGNGVPDECEADCNGNDVPDEFEIASGAVDDGNANGIPDLCEADCNANGVPDYDEIQADMSLDLDRDAVLDACEDCDGDGVRDIEALNHDHDVWIASLDLTSVRAYLARTGTLVARSGEAGISGGQDLLITTDRRVLVSSRFDDRVVEFGVSGNLVGDLVAPGAGGLSEPAGLVMAPDGRLLVASGGTNSVLGYDGADGTPRGAFVASGAGGLRGPFGLAFGPAGNLFVTSLEGRILEYDGTTGAFIAVFVDDAPRLSKPHGLLFLPGGNLLVASYGSNQVLEYDSHDGAFVGQFNHGGTADRLTLDQPWTLRLGPGGDVYVSRAHDHQGLYDGGQRLHLTNARIYQFDGDSGLLVRAYVLGVNSGLEHPTGFDFVPGTGADCNLNLVPDACDIAAGRSADANTNGVPDECETCPADLDGDAAVGFADLIELLAAWGPCPEEGACRGDLDNNRAVGLSDLLILLAAWGSCA